MAQPEGIPVILGEHEYRVQPQRHAYLKRELRKFMDSLSALADLDAENLLDVFTEKAYDMLAVFIPDLMERHEFEGFASAQAMADDEYDDAADHSPTPPQIKAALKAAMTVNDFDWVGQLKNFIGPDLIRASMRTQLAGWAAQNAQKTNSSTTSPSLPQRNGGSTQSDSGTPAPTSPTPQPATSA